MDYCKHKKSGQPLFLSTAQLETRELCSDQWWWSTTRLLKSASPSTTTSPDSRPARSRSTSRSGPDQPIRFGSVRASKRTSGWGRRWTCPVPTISRFVLDSFSFNCPFQAAPPLSWIIQCLTKLYNYSPQYTVLLSNRDGRLLFHYFCGRVIESLSYKHFIKQAFLYTSKNRPDAMEPNVSWCLKIGWLAQ